MTQVRRVERLMAPGNILYSKLLTTKRLGEIRFSKQVHNNTHPPKAESRQLVIIAIVVNARAQHRRPTIIRYIGYDPPGGGRRVSHAHTTQRFLNNYEL